MNNRQAILWRVITANARRIVPSAPTAARNALVATSLPELPGKATAAPLASPNGPDYDTCSDNEWNSWVMGFGR